MRLVELRDLLWFGFSIPIKDINFFFSSQLSHGVKIPKARIPKKKSGHSGSRVEGRDRDCGAVEDHSSFFFFFLSTNVSETIRSLWKPHGYWIHSISLLNAWFPLKNAFIASIKAPSLERCSIIAKCCDGATQCAFVTEFSYGRQLLDIKNCTQIFGNDTQRVKNNWVLCDEISSVDTLHLLWKVQNILLI